MSRFNRAHRAHVLYGMLCGIFVTVLYLLWGLFIFWMINGEFFIPNVSAVNLTMPMPSEFLDDTRTDKTRTIPPPYYTVKSLGQFLPFDGQNCCKNRYKIYTLREVKNVPLLLLLLTVLVQYYQQSAAKVNCAQLFALKVGRNGGR